MSVTGDADGAPVKVGVPLTDLGAGLFALIGILAALHHRAQTGRGQHIDTSLVDAGLALSVWEVTEYFTTGQVPGPLGSAHRMTAPYQAFRCADGYITIGAANDRNFAKLARVLGHPEWIDRCAIRRRSPARAASRRARRADRARSPRKEPRAFWIGAARYRPASRAGRSSTTKTRSTTPQAVAREMTVDVDHPDARRRCARSARRSRCRRRRSTRRRRAPMLGEHTDDVLAAAGYSDDEIEQLRSSGGRALRLRRLHVIGHRVQSSGSQRL